jgi:uncharacterized protein (TIGR02453 family)
MPPVTGTAARFTGFTPEAIQFLADLAQNNERAWFQPRKADYERLLRDPMAALIEALAVRLAERAIPLDADPKRSPFRIYRDTRFSKDKSPYKTGIGASFAWLGQPGTGDDSSPPPERGSGGYFHFQPGEMFVGGGMWMPDKARLLAFRHAVLTEPERVRAALEDPGFVAWFGETRPHDSLRRLPSGFPPDHPLADLFRWKNVIFGRPLADVDVCDPGLPDLLADGFAAAMPVFRFLGSLDQS